MMARSMKPFRCFSNLPRTYRIFPTVSIASSSTGKRGSRRQSTHSIAFALVTVFILILVVYLSGGWLTRSIYREKPELYKFRKFLHTTYPRLVSLDCKRLVSNDTEYGNKQGEHRITADPDSLNDAELPMDCPSIHARHFFPTSPSSAEEAAYPLARGQVVYKDYLQLEMLLAVSYQPQNWYCYTIDAKASARFHARIRALADCLPNVLMTDREFPIDGSGRHMDMAYFECLKLLLQSGRQWKYVSLLQNHDVSLKTNREMVMIMKLLNGANDVEVTEGAEGRVGHEQSSFFTYHLFRDESRNNATSPLGYPPAMVFSKGYSQCSLRREMVEFMLTELDMTRLMQRTAGLDEILIPTVHAMDALQAPGGFTHACLDRGGLTPLITRITKWGGWPCAQNRHAICVAGVEDLELNFRTLPQLYYNKMMPDVDFGAIACWYEWLFNRTHEIGEYDQIVLNLQYYADLPHARFQDYKRKFAHDANAYRSNLENFNCTFLGRVPNK